MKSSLKMVVQPKWEQVENVRSESYKFLQSHGLPKDAVHAFSMVVTELIENSIKYGDYNSSESKVEVDIDVTGSMMTVEVVNPVDETAYAHLRRLDKTIQWIRGYQDPFEAYVEKLKEVSKRQLDDAESGLGLARIAYEGGAIIDFFLGENDMLNVSAVSKLK
jgi:hypothetical protein